MVDGRQLATDAGQSSSGQTIAAMAQYHSDQKLFDRAIIKVEFARWYSALEPKLRLSVTPSVWQSA